MFERGTEAETQALQAKTGKLIAECDFLEKVPGRRVAHGVSRWSGRSPRPPA